MYEYQNQKNQLLKTQQILKQFMLNLRSLLINSKLADKNFAPVFIRNGTIYGISEFMRLSGDNFVLNAYLDKEIVIKVLIFTYTRCL